jgi:hypothetical protein
LYQTGFVLNLGAQDNKEKIGLDILKAREKAERGREN